MYDGVTIYKWNEQNNKSLYGITTNKNLGKFRVSLIHEFFLLKICNFYIKSHLINIIF